MSCIMGRTVRRSFSLSEPTALPPNQILPDVGYSKPARQKDSVLFPEPDSPTTPSVVPGKIEKDTPSSAPTSSRKPVSVFLAYRFTRFSTFMSGCMLWSLADASIFILETRNRMPVAQFHQRRLALSANLHSFRAS